MEILKLIFRKKFRGENHISILGIYEGSREWVNKFMVDGRPLVSEQQVRHTLAEVKTDAMIARQITDQQIEAYSNDDLGKYD